MKNEDSIVIEYNLGACFTSEQQLITIAKNKYYKLLNGKLKNISRNKIAKLIEYEKILRNIDIDKNLDNTVKIVTCSEFISFKKGNEIVFSKNIFCGDWSKSSEIVKWIK